MNFLELAVIADIHGNAYALEAVLADIERRGVRTIVNLGDNANGPIDPKRTMEVLNRCNAIHVRGNGDRMVGGGDSVRRSALFARERLDAEEARRLRDLPMFVLGDGWIAYHASPAGDEVSLLETVAGGRLVLAKDDEISSRLHGINFPIVLCGHTHLPRVVTLQDGRTVVNPGSVGLPAFRDDGPPPYIVENGSPDARYAKVRRESGGWTANLHAVKYDWKPAASAARAAGWEEWARNVETGYVTAN